MASYIGATPQIGGYHKLDAITSDGSASYTMQLNSGNFVPESANHLIVSVNGVIQAPTDSFTVSGSTITFASSLSASDTIDFIMALGNTLDIGTPSDGTISASKLATTSITGQTAETSANDSDSLLIYDDSATALRKMTRANFLTGVGGANTPAFEGKNNTSQSMSNNTYTKVTFGTENLDTDSCFASSRFTPTTSGKYFVYSTLTIQCGANVGHAGHIQIRKNGSAIFLAQSNDYPNTTINMFCVSASAIVELNGSTDYVEIYGLGENSIGTPALLGDANGSCIFGGYKIIE